MQDPNSGLMEYLGEQTLEWNGQKVFAYKVNAAVVNPMLANQTQTLYFNKQTRNVNWAEVEGSPMLIQIPGGMRPKNNFSNDDFMIPQCANTTVNPNFPMTSWAKSLLKQHQTLNFIKRLPVSLIS